MKKIVISLLAISTIICATSFAETQRLDNIVAVVNDDVVTSSELKHALGLLKMQMEHQNAPVSEKTLRKQVLTQLINKKLQLQIAKQNNIKASDEELEKAIAHIAEQNSMTTSELYSRLKLDGMSKDDYRTELRDQIVLHKLQQQELMGRINVTPQEIKRYKQTHAWQDNSEKEYHIEDILIPMPENASTASIAAAKKQAQLVADHLSQGKPLATIAKIYASAKTALQTDDLGWRKLSEIPSAFVESVTRMQKNAIAGPIQTGNGFHLLRLVNQRSIGGREAKLNEKQIENLLLQRKYEEAIEQWLVKMRAQAFIKLDYDKEKA